MFINIATIIRTVVKTMSVNHTIRTYSHAMKKNLVKQLFFAVSALFLVSHVNANEGCKTPMNFSAEKLRSNEVVDFCKEFSGRTLLVVNTASQCGFTPQFKDLEALHQKYSDEGLAIVGFPSKDFNQEYDDAEKTASICYENYGVTFTMMSESSVKGESANEFYSWLAKQTGESPAWNFNKYLVKKDGTVTHYGSSEKPLAGNIEDAIQKDIKK